MRYIICYVEEPDKEDDAFEVKRESFSDFASAVEKFTLCSIILADIETTRIIRQFFKDDNSGQTIIS